MKKFWLKIIQAIVTALYLPMFAVIVFIAVTWLRRIYELYQKYGFSMFGTFTQHGAFEYLIPFVVYSTAFVSLQAFNRNLKERLSRFFFEQSTNGIEEVYNMLKDQNNNRAIWVSAARTLLGSIDMSKQITLTEYKEAFHIIRERISSRLYTALTPNYGANNSLPARFFYGLSDWQEPQAVNRTLDETACLATLMGVKPLSRKSVVAIYDFILKRPIKLSCRQKLQEQLELFRHRRQQRHIRQSWAPWGLDDDPILNIQVWTFYESLLMDSGAHEYIGHRARFSSPVSPKDLQKCLKGQ